MLRTGKRAAILCRGLYGETGGKTARGLVLHSMNYEIVAVVDETLAGRDAGEIIDGRPRGIPIVADLEGIDYDVLIIGAAPVGGAFPDEWREDVKRALLAGKTVISGLHTFLSDDPELREIAEKHGGKILDLRKPPENLRIMDMSVRDVYVPIVLTMGTSPAIGKRITAVELVKAARRRGINAGFIATGQTGIMIGADAGVVIDRLPGDFISGMVEDMVVRVAEKRDMIFVEGQGALSHPAYCGVALSLLAGAWPDFVVLVHDPKKREFHGFPGTRVNPPEVEIDLIERLAANFSGAKVVALSVSGRAMTEEELERYVNEMERKLGMPVADVLRTPGGVDRILDEILRRAREKGYRV